MEKERPSYLKAKKRTREEVKIITDSYIMNNELSKIGIGKKYHIITYDVKLMLEIVRLYLLS